MRTWISRRAFLETGLTPFMVVSLLDTVLSAGLSPRAVAPVLAEWLRNLRVPTATGAPSSNVLEGARP
jgi:hypothetical protein